ncbi:LysR family transcriptional regulator [Pacificoceanicola onchidii]|uniref:LysR family transcriptional regulator n=1 Tax=Pacificoceanicola onchidii TaxID=2562685 RepID=UPI0010A438A5|nr:LysR family transcriptional regulator [Pacificoceanicola onchidii]
MNIDQIETFLDLCETRSFNRTASRLGVTQSTVSGRVRTLESALGCTLLRRSRAGTDLTTQGLRFEPHARTMRRNWTVAREAVRETGQAANMRVAIQHDILGERVAPWITALQSALPDTAFHVEGDYSTQMCADVADGYVDFAILFTPKPNPDLHFESIGTVSYQMIASEADTLDQVKAESYILPLYSQAFAMSHAELLPDLSVSTISCGEHAVGCGLFTALGGATYVLRRTAQEMQAAGEARIVVGAPIITQPVFAALHLRNRHRAPFRRIMRTLRDDVVGRP